MNLTLIGLGVSVFINIVLAILLAIEKSDNSRNKRELSHWHMKTL